MALYSFTCPDCGVEFEKMFARVSAEPKADCPTCGSTNPKREFGLPAKGTKTSSAVPMSACPPGNGPCGTFGCQRGG